MEKDKLLKYVNNRIKLVLLKKNIKTPNDIFIFFRKDELLKNFFRNINDKDLSVICFLLSISFENLDYKKYYDTIVYTLFGFDIGEVELDYNEKTCSACNGDGTVECDDCSGSGDIECDDCYGEGSDEEGDTCQRCDGDGKLTCDSCLGNGTEDCYECDGTGEYDDYDEYTIRAKYYISYDKKLMDRLLSYDEDDVIDYEIINDIDDKSIMVTNYTDTIDKSLISKLDTGDHYLISSPRSY